VIIMPQTQAGGDAEHHGAGGGSADPDDGSSCPLVVVSNRLPVERVRDQDGRWHWRASSGGLVTALEPVVERTGGVWIGWPGTASDSERGPGPGSGPGGEDGAGIPTEPFEVAGPSTGRPFTIAPVPLTAEEVERYYEGFSNGTLWPLYHDVIAQPEYHRIWWDAYKEVNHRFAQAAADAARPGSRVWIQDYQLQLVPRMLRELRPDVSIGFFNHIPFPAPGIYAQLPWRQQILRGLLGADLVGFQRAGDARNFAQAVRQLLGWTVHRGVVEVPLDDEARTGWAARRDTTVDLAGRSDAGRSAALVAEEMPPTRSEREEAGREAGSGRRPSHFGAFPISVDFASWDALGNDPEVRARASQIRHELGSPRTVLLGVDRLDYTKGISHRLKAYGELLDEHRLDVGDTILVEMAIPTREGVSAYQDLREEVEVAVSRINGDHSTVGRSAVQYMHRNLPRREVAALYEAADVLLVTSLRDGMNLVAKEYIAASVDIDGVLILSEFTGAADELRQALIVNPHDVDAIKEAIVRATRMSPRERARRMRQLRRTVRTHDVGAWSAGFLAELDRASASRMGPWRRREARGR
jgi:trehalose 6-phosphate synthase